MLSVQLIFVNKPFNIDDHKTIESIQRTPYGQVPIKNFFSKENYVYFLGETVPYYKFTKPPLNFLYCHFCYIIVGEVNETYFHLFYIIFYILSIVSMYFILKEFDLFSFTAIFLFSFSSILFTSSISIMSDVPMFSFFLLAFLFFIKGVKNDNVLLLILSGLTSIISWGIDYRGIFLLFLFVLYYLIFKKKKFIYYIPFLICLSSILIWIIFTTIKFGFPHPLYALMWPGDTNLKLRAISMLIPKFISNIIVIGSTTIFPISIIALYLLKSVNKKLLIIQLLITIACTIFFTRNFNFISRSLFIIFLFSGLLIMFRIIKEFIRPNNSVTKFLSICFLLYLIICTLIMPLGIARYLLITLPVITIIISYDLINLNLNLVLKKVFIAITLILTLGNTIGITYADYRFAESYKRFADEIKSTVKNNRVWFMGEWGFRYYLEKIDAKYYCWNSNELKENDIMIIPTYSCPAELKNSIRPDLLHIEKVIYKSKFPYRIMNAKAHAGFYDNNLGILPYSLSNVELENINIFRFDRQNHFAKIKTRKVKPEHIINMNFKYFKFIGYSIEENEQEKILSLFVRFEKYKPTYAFFHDNIGKPDYQKWKYIAHYLLDLNGNVRIDLEIESGVKNGYILFTNDNLKPIYPIGDKNNCKMEIK